MVSLYARFTHTDDRMGPLNPNSPEDFGKWLLTWNDSKDRAAYQKGEHWFGQTAHWDTPVSSTKMSQLYYLTDDEGNLLVDVVGRFENLEKDFGVICSDISISGNLQHVRKGPHKRHWKEYYNNETNAHIFKHFANDIEAFGYTFGE
jgi:hypothetical protein